MHDKTASLFKDRLNIDKIKSCYDNKPNSSYSKQKLISYAIIFITLAIITLIFHLLLSKLCLSIWQIICLYCDIAYLAYIVTHVTTHVLTDTDTAIIVAIPVIAQQLQIVVSAYFNGSLLC